MGARTQRSKRRLPTDRETVLAAAKALADAIRRCDKAAADKLLARKTVSSRTGPSCVG